MSMLVDRTLEPLDDVRSWLWRASVRVPGLRSILVRRAVRVPWLLAAHALAAFALVLVAPALSLVLTPLVLGVPHVAADVRYLMLRRALPRALWVALAVFAFGMIALRLLYELRRLHIDPLLAEHALGSCQLLVGAVFGAAMSSSRVRGALAIAAACALGSLALVHPEWFRLGLVHAHNLVAIVIWAVLFRRASLGSAWLPLSLITLATLALMSGVGLTFTLRHGIVSLFGMHIFEAADQLAPGIDGELGLSLTLTFAFLQSVHYAIWLLAVPQEDTRAEGSPNFRMKARALVRDFGRSGCLILAAAMLLMALGGVFSPVRTRNTYLSLASFHGWLELALLAFFAPQRVLGLRADPREAKDLRARPREERLAEARPWHAA
jgi:hypothetical protein